MKVEKIQNLSIIVGYYLLELSFFEMAPLPHPFYEKT
jgi:hypothetical protein